MKKNDIRYCSNGNLAAFSFRNIIDAFVPIKIPDYTRVFLYWDEIVSKNISEFSFPDKILIIKNKNGLLIKSKKGYAVSLQHSSPQILKALNNYLNEDFFSFIKILQLDDKNFLKGKGL